MESATFVSVADLLRQSHPISGAAFTPSSSPPPPKKFKPHHTTFASASAPTPVPAPAPAPASKSFSPLPYSGFLTGTVSLPADHLSPCLHPQIPCLTFSDGSAVTCCAVLDIDPDILGRPIHVIAFNFLPFKNNSSTGVLEIISWRLASPRPLHNPTPRSRVCSGALRAVSPVFRVPCRNQVDSPDSVGFLAEIVTCECGLQEPQHSHSLAKPVTVYLLGEASRWRLVLSEVIGKFVKVSGLKKKMVFVGEDSYLMLVATAETVVSRCWLPPLPMDGLLTRRAAKDAKSDGTMYFGVVTGVYMQGMVVELDEKVWLLITDPLIAPQHSLRVGAMISVRSYHVVRPKFSWTRVLLLGSCSRTSIHVHSFSPSDTRCYSRIQSQSPLGKFIESLTFSARFWVLLLVACFRRKFVGIFSDKEILGSKNKEGLVLIYARASLMAHPLRHQRGVFIDFCKHDQCTYKGDWDVNPLKLVIPISNLLSKCETIWVSILSEIQRDTKTVGVLSNEGASYCRVIRRIISSEDLGFVLMGTLKVSHISGRLQLVDGTGSIDIVVPDLPSNIDGLGIQEIKDYKLVIEGLPTQLVSLGSHSAGALSCRNIFQPYPYRRLLNKVDVYVHCYLKELASVNGSSCLLSCQDRSVDHRKYLGEKFHLLLVTHKFPNSVIDPNLSNSSSLFAEASILPYNLILSEEDVINEPQERLQCIVKACSEYFEKQQESEIISSRRPTHKSRTNSGLISKSQEFEARYNKISCLLTFRRNNLKESSLAGYLCSTVGCSLENIAYNERSQRILLEFKSDSFCRYQLLHIGAYYILKCSCTGGCEKISCGRALVSYHTTLWNFSFSFGEEMHRSKLPVGHSHGVSSNIVGEVISGSFCQNEVLFRSSLNKMYSISDVHLYFPSDETGLVKEEAKSLKDCLTGILPAINNVLSVSSCIKLMSEFASPCAAVSSQSSNLPQGNLVSVCGYVENIHSYNCKSKSFGDSEHSSNDQTKPCMICIHVYEDHHMVQICGDFSKYTYLVGMGPGANVTFHRVLLTCSSSRWRKLFLSPVSYVVINSVKETGHDLREMGLSSSLRCNLLVVESFDNVSLALFSQLTQRADVMLSRFYCRIVTITILVLEKHTQQFGKSQSRRDLKMPMLNIPLAGFVLDDGSSLFCCWADAGNAMSFLRLHETTSRASFCSQKRSKKAGNKGTCSTLGCHLEKILKKHHRVIARNHGAITGSSCQDITFTVDPNEVFSNSEESLLRFLVLNACEGPVFNIVGNQMDSNALEWLGTQLTEYQATIRPMQNVWIRDVANVDPLKEARNLLDALVAG